VTRHGASGRTRTVVTVLAFVGLLGATAACSDDPGDAKPSVAASTSGAPAPAPSPTLTITPTPSATPSAAGVVDRSDPELGITFEDIPDVTGAQAEALDTLMQFQVEFWRSRVDGTVAPGMDKLAVGAALAQVKDVVATNAENGWSTGGEAINTYTDLAGSKSLVVVDLCADERKTTYTKDGDVTQGSELDMARQAIRAEVAVQATGGWAVQTYQPGKSC
jgi:hypothetical protein